MGFLLFGCSRSGAGVQSITALHFTFTEHHGRTGRRNLISAGGRKPTMKKNTIFFVSVDYIKGCPEIIRRNGRIARVNMKE